MNDRHGRTPVIKDGVPQQDSCTLCDSWVDVTCDQGTFIASTCDPNDCYVVRTHRVHKVCVVKYILSVTKILNE